jgi:hypothetical protein
MVEKTTKTCELCSGEKGIVIIKAAAAAADLHATLARGARCHHL